MFAHKFHHQLFAIVASLLMSTIAVGAAVAPSTASASSINVLTYA